MRKDRVLSAVTLGALALLLVLVAVVLVQLHRVEARFIAQGIQLRALGDATDRLMAGGVRSAPAAAGAQAEEAPPPGVKLLHPEVENFLKPADTRFPAPGAPTDGTLIRGFWGGEPKGFNPLLENAADLTEFIELYAALPLAERNVFTNPDVWHGRLAWRVEVTDDFKEFTFYLRPGVKWHEPVVANDPAFAWIKGSHPVTADDFVFTIDMIMNPQAEVGPIRNYYQALESWKAIDETTLVLRWKKKLYTNLAQSLALAALPRFLYGHDQQGKPFPKETLGLRFNQHWYNNKAFIGAGPYRMTTYEPGSKMVLERVDGSPGDKPAIKTLLYPMYTDSTQTPLKLRAHELNFGEMQAAQYREEIQRYQGAATKPKDSPFLDGRIDCKPVTGTSFRYVGYNADRPIFGDPRVRRAMTHSLDRKRLIENVYVGLGTITTSPYPVEAPYNDPDIKPIPFDLAAAAALLKEAGWVDTDGDGLLDKLLRPGDAKRTPFEFALLINTARKESAVLANIFRDDLLKIGVKANIEAVEWSLFLKRMDEKNFDAFFGAWTVGWDPDLYQIWHSSQADTPKGSNRVGFRNKEADVIIEKLRETFDKDERTTLLRRFHRIVDELQPYTFFMVPRYVHCTWREVQGVMFSKEYPTVNTFPWSVARRTP